MFDNVDRPANIREEDSETPWLTSEAIRFLDQAKDPWCVHLSYIKPHWPYIAPAPYHAMYGANHVSAALRSEVERKEPAPHLRRLHREEARRGVPAGRKSGRK